ncbi:MAG TPA: hypothetical protein PKD85_08515, partial [Saprospiraceae bacterium]|nr:hypothetical protein [Saprospiraceae bacterium]
DCIDTLTVTIEKYNQPILSDSLVNIFCEDSFLLHKSLMWSSVPNSIVYAIGGMNFRSDSIKFLPSENRLSLVTLSNESCLDTYQITINRVPIVKAQIQNSFQVLKNEIVNLQLDNSDDFSKFKWLGPYDFDCDTCEITNILVNKSAQVVGKFLDQNQCLDTIVIKIIMEDNS